MLPSASPLRQEQTHTCQSCRFSQKLDFNWRKWLLKFDCLHASGNRGIDYREPIAQTHSSGARWIGRDIKLLLYILGKTIIIKFCRWMRRSEVVSVTIPAGSVPRSFQDLWLVQSLKCHTLVKQMWPEMPAITNPPSSHTQLQPKCTVPAQLSLQMLLQLQITRVLFICKGLSAAFPLHLNHFHSRKKKSVCFS